MGPDGACESGDKPSVHDVLSAFRQVWRAKLRSPPRKPEFVPELALMQETQPKTGHRAQPEPTPMQEEQSKTEPNEGVPQPQPPRSETTAVYEVDLDPSSDDCPTEEAAQHKSLLENETTKQLVDEIPPTLIEPPLQSTKTAMEERRSASRDSVVDRNIGRATRELSRSKESNVESSATKPRILLIGRRNVGRKNALTDCSLPEVNRVDGSPQASPSQPKSPPVRPRQKPSASRRRSSPSHPRSSPSQTRSSVSQARESHRTVVSPAESLENRQSHASSQPHTCCEESNASSHQDVLPRKKLVTKKRKKRRIKRRHKKDREEDTVKHTRKRRHHDAGSRSPHSEKSRKKKAKCISNSAESHDLAPSSNRNSEAPASESEDSSAKKDGSEQHCDAEATSEKDGSEQHCDAEATSERKDSHSGRSDSSAVERGSSHSAVLKRTLKRKKTSSQTRQPKTDTRGRRIQRSKTADVSKSISPETSEDVAVERYRAAALQAFGLTSKNKSADAKGRAVVMKPSPEGDDIPSKRRAALRAFGIR